MVPPPVGRQERPRQEQLLQLLSGRGSLAPRKIRAFLGVSRQGAMDLIKPLVEAGLVVREGTRKSGRYKLSKLQPES